LFLAVAGLTLSLWPADLFASSARCPISPCGPIKHVVIIIRENHSFDNLFGRFPGADGATIAKQGASMVPMTVTPDSLKVDLGHGSHMALKAIDGGKMDRFFSIPNAVQNGHDVSESQYTQQQIPGYWAYAGAYSLADHFFSSVMGGSFPNHLAAIAGQSLNVIDNPGHLGTLRSWGCDAGPGVSAQIYSQNKYSQVYPCFTAKTLADEANAAHIVGNTTHLPKAPSGTSGRHSTP
jgi:phospholipase C